MRPCVHDGQLVGHGERLFLVVRHEQERDADAPLHGFQLHAHLLAQLGIERGQGLIEQQDVGLEHQRPGQRHALPLAARKLRRAGVSSLPVEADQLQRIAHPPGGLGNLCAALESEFDVLARGQVREQGVALKYGADVALIRLAVVDRLRR